MGLAASQARLLTITARKSDCEAQSMRYSHQKLALSRDLTNLSNQYQNSLDQTKLVYDFYGTGDETTPLSYGLMMTPSEMNGYLPMLVTDASGKTILSSQYAAAARAAGIPQEGLGCLPSSDIRNKFIQGMADSGLITQDAANTYMGIQYSQDIGNGTTDLVTTNVQHMTLAELLEYYEQSGAVPTTVSFDNWWNTLDGGEDTHLNAFKLCDENGTVLSGSGQSTNISLRDILSGNYRLLAKVNQGTKNKDLRDPAILAGNIQYLDIWEWMFGEFESILNVAGDSNITAALSYAKTQTMALLDTENNGYGTWQRGETKEYGFNNFQGVLACMDTNSSENDGSWWQNGLQRYEATFSNSQYIGVCVYDNVYPFQRKKRADGISINISNIATAYLTYFAEYMQGTKLAETKYYVDTDNSDGRRVDQSSLISLEDESFLFDVVVDTGINADQALISGFHDAIFNQICLRGWTENNQIQDNDYMQEMLKTGKFFLATCTDDGYYYQGNYSTNTYVREITDDEAIAKAEAKYNTEKQKLNQKEEILDLKMKNLDTEISSLTTEYDTVKSVISKNIEKSFKRYDA